MPSPLRLIDYLPEIYRNDPFLGNFLQTFDQVLLGTGDPTQPGIEEKIAGISRYFDPALAPDAADQDFLSWLAGWTAFSMRSDLSSIQQRDFIAKVIPLYQQRGTKNNLMKLLEIFITIGRHVVTESVTVPHSFEVQVFLPTRDLDVLGRQHNIAKALIDLEKPAHTTYKLTTTPIGGIQVGKVATIGFDTLISVLQNPTP
jgi:phage tail-like protein